MALLSQIYQIIDMVDLRVNVVFFTKQDLTQHVLKYFEKESICFCRRLLEIDMVTSFVLKFFYLILFYYFKRVVSFLILFLMI